MPLGAQLGKKIDTLQQTTEQLENSIDSMTSELCKFKAETIGLTEQVEHLADSLEKFAKIFETQIKTLNDSLQTLGKNLTQNVVENILSLPKIVPDFLKKKRDSSNLNTK